MNDSNWRARPAVVGAANDNTPRAIRTARQGWAEEQALIKGGTYQTLKLVINLADADGVFHVDGGAFVRALKVSRKTVFNHLKVLMAAGLIQNTGKKRWVHTYYKLTLPAAAGPPPRSSENAPHVGEEITEQSGKTGTHKTFNYQYDQRTSHEVSIRSELKRNKGAPFRSSASQVKPLEPHEGQHLPAELRERFLAYFDEPKARSWLFRCTWNTDGGNGNGVLETTSESVRQWFDRNGRPFCRENGIKVRLKQAARG